jgi:hypothetical protein
MEMRDIALVTDDDLARARVDPKFRHRLVADNLELLLGELNRLRSGKTDARRAKQIREGVNLAVQLAEILQRIERAPELHAG